jgi:hypothetical protein
MLPDEKLTLLRDVFKSMVTEVIEHIIKIRDKKFLRYLNPVIAILKQKNVTDVHDHLAHELIKLMAARDLVSEPGEYVVVFKDC